MIKLEALVAVVAFVLWVFCLVDTIQTPESRMRHLPKVAWVALVLLFPLVGSVAWLVAGRPGGSGRRRAAHERATPAFPEYDRPGRFAATEPGRDDDFLRQVRERAEAQRKAYDDKVRRERAEQAERRKPGGASEAGEPGEQGGGDAR